ncbi:MAG: hypothetical protein JXB45_04615 [Candidatus Krumholzibacteriota bacterium]|nr:hypothetical protein [Candidatus Krumholzibacteriota bacterium]
MPRATPRSTKPTSTPGSLILLPILLLIPFTYSRADIAPDPMTAGMAITQFEGEVTAVRMVEEDVVVRVFKDRVVTVAEFSMYNEGETIRMEVGFPYAYEDEFIEFQAFVDGRKIHVRDARKENVGRKKVTQYWKLWKMTFKQGKACNIKVKYQTKPYENNNFYIKNYPSLPDDILSELQQVTRSGHATYWVYTGKGWKGTLDRCRISFELVDKSDGNIKSYHPQEGKLTERGVAWEYTDYEPSGFVSIEYFPHMTVRDIPPYVCGVVDRFPHNPKLASDVGSWLHCHLGEEELHDKIYHAFIANWDEPIPQLMEYTSGGRCRFNYNAGNHFYTTWQMAATLFNKYLKAEKLEEGIDIAPTVSKISGAIVDSLDTCYLSRRDQSFYRRAKELLDLSNSLIDDED